MEHTNQHYEIGKDVFVTSKILRRYIDKQMPCEAVSGGQGRILGLVVMKAQCGEALYQRDIETEFQIRGSSVTSILQLMEKKGLITRESSKKDARYKRLLPTEEGIRVHEQVRSTITQAETGMISQITEEELIVFKRVMEKLRAFAADGEGGNSTC